MVSTSYTLTLHELKDTPLTYEALTAPDLTYTLIKPLEDKYLSIQRKGNFAIVFCFLLNRVHFLRDQHLVTAPISRSRATLCEILAIRILRELGDNTLEMALVTTTSWLVYSGADEDLLKQTMEGLSIDDVEERVGNAIEMAIIGKAKRFIKSPACQRVIDSIWRYAGHSLSIYLRYLLNIVGLLKVVNVYIKLNPITPFYQM